MPIIVYTHRIATLERDNPTVSLTQKKNVHNHTKHQTQSISLSSTPRRNTTLQPNIPPTPLITISPRGVHSHVPDERVREQMSVIRTMSQNCPSGRPSPALRTARTLFVSVPAPTNSRRGGTEQRVSHFFFFGIVQDIAEKQPQRSPPFIAVPCPPRPAQERRTGNLCTGLYGPICIG